MATALKYKESRKQKQKPRQVESFNSLAVNKMKAKMVMMGWDRVGGREIGKTEW